MCIGCGSNEEAEINTTIEPRLFTYPIIRVFNYQTISIPELKRNYKTHFLYKFTSYNTDDRNIIRKLWISRI